MHRPFKMKIRCIASIMGNIKIQQGVKHFTLLLFCLAVSAVAAAQPSEKRASSLSRLLHNHAYHGEYERPVLKVEAPKNMSRAKNALGAPFAEPVWFPGEWEEVKAVVVTARIIHKNIHGDVNPVKPDSEEQYIPFSAIITNKSGIKEASFCYTTDGNQWFEVMLTANGNCWHADIPLSNYTGG